MREGLYAGTPTRMSLAGVLKILWLVCLRIWSVAGFAVDCGSACGGYVLAVCKQKKV